METITQNGKKFNPAEHLISLKGKDYLQVAWRIYWFRSEHPNWCIHTCPVEITDNRAIFKAAILDENGVEKATGHGSETKSDFGDFIEKAETKSIGRAMAALGFGTQFAPELDEGERIVDSPVERKKSEPAMYICQECGDVITPHSDGKNEYGVMQIAETTKKRYGKMLCWDCAVEAKNG